MEGWLLPSRLFFFKSFVFFFCSFWIWTNLFFRRVEYTKRDKTGTERVTSPRLDIFFSLHICIVIFRGVFWNLVGGGGYNYFCLLPDEKIRKNSSLLVQLFLFLPISHFKLAKQFEKHLFVYILTHEEWNNNDIGWEGRSRGPRWRLCPAPSTHSGRSIRKIQAGRLGLDATAVRGSEF